MPSPRLAVDVSDRTIRVLEGLPGGPMRSGELSAPDGAIEAGRVMDPVAVGKTLRQLLARTGIVSTRALLAASDVIASFRVLSFREGTSDEAIDTAVRNQLPAADQRLAVRRIDVPTNHPGRTVYAAVWDRGQVLAISESARLAGVDPAVVDLKSLCVARALTLGSCVLLDMSVAPYEILLIEDHIPRVWHSFSPGQDGDVATSIAAGLKPVLAFYRQGAGKVFPSDWPIVIRSDEAPPPLMSERLAELCERPVEGLPRPARIDPDLRVGPYLACVGLVMRRRA